MKVKRRTFIVYGLGNEFKPELFKQIKNRIIRPWVKPYPKTGLWASPVNSSWGWFDWCKSEDFRQDTGFNSSFKFKLKSGSRILIINSYKNLASLKKYIIKETIKPFSLVSFALDFEKLAKDYDAIFLTELGQHLTRLSEPENLYGWDCESILILNKDIIIPV